LGGNVYKHRVARPGAGDPGGYRVIVFFKSGERTLFVYGFAKADMANINEKEKQLYKQTAKDLLALTDKQMTARVDDGRFEEVLI
jgi:hypothetical protein